MSKGTDPTWEPFQQESDKWVKLVPLEKPVPLQRRRSRIPQGAPVGVVRPPLPPPPPDEPRISWCAACRGTGIEAVAQISGARGTRATRDTLRSLRYSTHAIANAFEEGRHNDKRYLRGHNDGVEAAIRYLELVRIIPEGEDD